MSVFKIGDFVEVDLGLAIFARGEVITENAYRANIAVRTTSIIAEAYPTSYKIKFLDDSTHTANPEELRVLPEKEQFVLKLKGGGDKELAKIYEILDERANGK